jgi:hypothetical protein
MNKAPSPKSDQLRAQREAQAKAAEITTKQFDRDSAEVGEAGSKPPPSAILHPKPVKPKKKRAKPVE